MRKKILFIGRGASNDSKLDGGEYGARRVQSMVEHTVGIYNVESIIIEKPKFMQRIKNMLLFQSYGHTKTIKSKIKSIDYDNVELVFFNGSVYGRYVKMIAKKGINVMIFYHNVEHNFYLDKFKATKKLSDLWMYLYIWYNEKLTTKYSKYRITLNQRDSNELNKVYNKIADLISPSSYDYIGVAEDEINNDDIKNQYLLFVGGNFFSNIDGIKSFIEEALPKIDMDLWVVGNCCKSLEKWVNEKEHPRVKLKGFVEDLTKIYKEASAVICPIYSGSGMKTKTVEALKFGKYIFATKESFEGIDGDYNRIGALCNNSEEFVKAINFWMQGNPSKYNEYSFNIFMNNYSNEIVFKRFKDFLISCDITLGE